jgi:hypothetical protein
MPPETTVLGWIEREPVFAERYARARQRQYQRWAEEILEISDDVTLDPNDRRVRVDSRKWLLSKLLPKQYGDKIEVNATISKRDPVELTDAEILAELGAAGGPSATLPRNPPLLEHNPDPYHNSSHDPERAQAPTADGDAASQAGSPQSDKLY